MRRPAVSGTTCSSAMNFRTSAAAFSVSVSVMGVCVVAMMYPPMREQVSHAGRSCQPPACIPARRSHNWGPPPRNRTPMRLDFLDWSIIVLYFAIPINCIILGWVNLAMVKILQLLFNVGKVEALIMVLGMIALTSMISTLSGLWGVLVTDLFQFVIKMGMVIVLAVVAVQAVGGMDAMKMKLAAIDQLRGATSGGRGSVLSFVPDIGSAWMPMITFLVYVSLQWWSTWYPGAEPGGGGYVAQRMFSAKDEKHSLLATLWFNIAHY